MGLFDVGGKFKPRNVAGVESTRFIEPHGFEDIDDFRVKYANAEKLAKDIKDVPLNFRAFCLLDGKFIFGDFIEALIVQNNWEVEDLTISTLSMSQENVDSLQNLITGEFVKQLNLIVSHYYFANERHSAGMMPYIYDQLDINDVLQVAVASVHTKIAMIRTACGKKITIHGSANLRTSSNIEQIVIEHTPNLYDWCYEAHMGIMERHKTINKPVRRTQLWSAILGTDESDTPSWQQAQNQQDKNSQNTMQESSRPLHQGHPQQQKNAAQNGLSQQSRHFKAGA